MITRIKATNYRCFERLDFTPNEQINIVVGGNEAGKSTLLEIIALVISGRVRGRWASDDLNPYWFNHKTVQDYFTRRELDKSTALPTIEMELYFHEDTPGAERLRGIHNSRSEDCPGLRMRIEPDEERYAELAAYLSNDSIPELIPTDLYQVDWRSFACDPVSRQTRGLGFTTLNVNTIASSTSLDHRLRQLLRDFVTPQESAEIALQHRRAKAELTSGVLQEVNKRVADEDNTFGVSLQMDHSANADWDVAVAPYIENTPFTLLGKGRQVATKIALAMSRKTDNTKFVLVEEPENHLSHTELHKMLDRITSLSDGRQLFITTHSSFVLNRLGFDTLQLIHNAQVAPLNHEVISKDTIEFFQKLPGFDTLRLATAERVVVVEGPTDEMVFNMAYQQIKGKEPRDHGIDVVSLGTSGKRALELAKALDRRIAVIRDNDGQDPEHWRDKVQDLLHPDKRQMFIGDPSNGHTLEPQLISCNDEATLREAIEAPDATTLESFMAANKTEWVWRLASKGTKLNWPHYITEAIEFVSDS